MSRRPIHNALLPTLVLLLAALVAALPGLAQSPLPETMGFHVFGPNNHTGQDPTNPRRDGGHVAIRCPHQTPPFIHWDLRQFPGCAVPWEINPNIPDPNQTLAPAAVRAAIVSAANSWSAASPAYITLFDNSNGNCPQAPGLDGRNCAAFDPNWLYGPNMYAITYLWRNATSGNLWETDIGFNPQPGNQIWRLPPAPGQPCVTPDFAIETVAVHEFGHSLGLAHTNDTGPGCPDYDLMQKAIMYAYGPFTDACRVKLQQADRDGVNYLYTADLGDLPDPPYPTLVQDGGPNGQVLSGVALKQPGDGPQHLFGIFADPDPNVTNQPRYQYEWLAFQNGAIDDHPAECEARPVDAFDDGVSINGQCINGILQSPLSVTIHVKTSLDVMQAGHNYNPAAGGMPMYANGWFDWNFNGVLEEGIEHPIGLGAGVLIPGAGVYNFQVPVPPDTPCDVASRFRLDWGEDVGELGAPPPVDPTLRLVRGAAQHGEVEDYIGLNILHPDDEYCHPVHKIPLDFPMVNMRLFIEELCHPPKPSGSATAQTFDPNPGSECMDSGLCMKVDGDGDGFTDEQICLRGPVCIDRGAPYIDPATGLNTIDTQMVSLDMTGYSHFAGEMQIHLAPDIPTVGQIQQSEEARDLGIDISPETPASSYFDVFFVVESELLGPSEVVGPSLVTAEISAVPPGEVIGGEPPPPPPPDGEPVPPPSEEPLP
jgi:hypothetical protein